MPPPPPPHPQACPTPQPTAEPTTSCDAGEYLVEGTGCAPCTLRVTTTNAIRQRDCDPPPPLSSPPSPPPTHRFHLLRPLHAGPRGTFTSTSGEDECALCEPGRVAVTTGSTVCSRCPSGTSLEAVDEGEDEPSRHDDLLDCTKCAYPQRASWFEAGGRPCSANTRSPRHTCHHPLHHLYRPPWRDIRWKRAGRMWRV